LPDIDLTLTPLAASPAGASSPRYRVTGTVDGLPARELRFEGEVGTENRTIDLNVSISDLEVSHDLLATIPWLPAAMLTEADATGRADMDVKIVRSDPNAPLAWSVKLAVDRGTLAHRKLPAPLNEISFTASADSQRLYIEKLTGQLGPAQITLACDRAGWSAQAPLSLAARIEGLPLDERLRSALPESLARAWRRFQPAGICDAEVALTFDGHAWRPRVSATCRGISLTDLDRFPYPLQQVTGKVQFDAAGEAHASRLQLDLTGIGGSRPVRILADLTEIMPSEGEEVAGPAGLAESSSKPGLIHRIAGYRSARSLPADSRRPHHPVGWVEISATDVPLHEQLFVALPDKVEPLIRSLQPQGAVDFRFRVEWKTASQPLADRVQDIQLKDCTIQYQRFPYPLYRVNGLITERGRQWTLHDIQARGGSSAAMVRCSGQSTPRGAGYFFDLTFDATNVPLDDSLKRALAPPAQLAWNELQPLGRVDFRARVIHESGQPKPVVEITLEPREQSVSIQPAKFPYRLEQIDGLARYRDGRVELADLRARHNRTEFSAASGVWQPTPQGGWQLALGGVDACRLTPERDRDLLVALPPGARTILERLQPAGTFDVFNSSLSLVKAPQSEDVAAAWDVNLHCHHAAIQGGLPVQSVTGEIRLTGRHDAQSVYSSGELNLNSVIWNDMQFTNVHGPIWIDPSYCLLGMAAGERQQQPPRRITADVYGGTLTANAALQHGANPNYSLDLMIGAADLARFAKERLGQQSELGGTVSGRIAVSGAGRSLQTLNGTGELHVVDAKIYELPPLVSLLKVLRTRTPTATAFNTCDMQFTLQGEQIDFQHLDLRGDAMSLYGKGKTNLDRELDLVFYTLIGPADLPIPLWKTIAGQVSQQGLQLKVVGSWDNPDVQRKALPAVNDAWQQIQAEIQAGAATMAPATAGRSMFAPPR
jgi:hypothetical protein